MSGYGNYGYHLDGMLKNKDFDGLILDLRGCPYFKGKSVDEDWIKAVVQYIDLVARQRYGIKHVYLLIDDGTFTAFKEIQSGTKLVDFVYGWDSGHAGSMREILVDENGYPDEDSKPLYAAPRVDFWYYAEGEWLYILSSRETFLATFGVTDDDLIPSPEEEEGDFKEGTPPVF